MDWIVPVRENPLLSLMRLNCLSAKENSRRGFLFSTKCESRLVGKTVRVKRGWSDTGRVMRWRETWIHREVRKENKRGIRKMMGQRKNWYKVIWLG